MPILNWEFIHSNYKILTLIEGWDAFWNILGFTVGSVTISFLFIVLFGK